jgi:hypothetical protein
VRDRDRKEEKQKEMERERKMGIVQATASTIKKKSARLCKSLGEKKKDRKRSENILLLLFSSLR